MFSADTFRRLWPHARPELIEAVTRQAPVVFSKYGLTDALAVADAMAQFSHECGADTEGVENLNYSVRGLIRTWPSHFNAVNAPAYAHQPRKLANYIYEPPCHEDLGNRPGSDDGWNYIGRGGAQTTGRDANARLAEKTGLDLVSNPNLVNEPEHWLECAVADFVMCGCLPFALRDDIRGVTHHLNGGLLGLAERTAWLKRWKEALAAEDHAATERAPSDDGVLRYGDHGEAVEAAQRLLAALGYPVGAADGDFGPATRSAVLAFQADRGLPTDGEIGPVTRDALTRNLPRPVSESRSTANADDLRKAGSVTVEHADNSSTLGKVIVIGSGLGAAERSGVFDWLREATEKFQDIKPVFDAVQDITQWAASHWYFGVAVAGFAIWFFSRKIIATRLADHQAGANMGR
jgi:putative chitinase